MKNQEEIKQALNEIATLNIASTNKGGPTEDGDLFEQVLRGQENLLKKFGLPFTSENQNILWFKEMPTDLEIDYKVKLLHETASEYLLSKPQIEYKILSDAQEQKLDEFMVLPELKIETHLFTIFVYYEILLKDADTIENVLAQLKLVNNNETLGMLGRLVFSKTTEQEKQALTKSLADKGVKYLDEYIIFHKNIL